MRIGRMWTWWNAMRDRRAGLPAPEAKWIGDSEAQIVAAVDAWTRRREERYHCAAEPRLRALAQVGAQLETIDLPHYRLLVERTGRTHEELVLSAAWHRLLLAVLTVGELAFNMIVFLVFGESTLLTWAMAAAVGLGLPATAAFLGADLRQTRWTAPRIAGWAVVLTVVGITLAGINYVRTSYLSVNGQSEFVAANAGLTLAYFAINMFVFVAATLASCYGKDPQRGFVEAKGRIERGQRLLAVNTAALNRLGRELRSAAAQQHALGLALICRYRSINRRRRSAVPAYFDDAALTAHRPTLYMPNVPEFDHAKIDAQPLMRFAPGRSSSAAVVLLAAGLAIGTTACSGPLPERFVVMFADGSCSVASRALYATAWSTVVTDLRPGDRVLLGRISADTYSMFEPIVDEVIPRHDWMTNALVAERKDTAVRARLRSRFAELDAQPCAARTPLLDAMAVAGKLFAGEARRGVLVVASDMLEDGERYRFDRMHLVPQTTERILQERRQGGMLPDLSGVTVYVTGAGGPSATVARQVEVFWQEFFRATGALLASGHYGPILLSYEQRAPVQPAQPGDKQRASTLAGLVTKVWPKQR